MPVPARFTFPAGVHAGSPTAGCRTISPGCNGAAVAKQECPTDGRGAFATLTDAGLAAITAAAPDHAATVRRLMFDGLTPEQVATVDQVTRHVLDRVAAEDLGADVGGPPA